jgi:two-component system chemotaxis response regulator CheB
MARERIKTLNPDVITLDIEMPRMDGLDFLERIMALRPMPVIMVSSLSQRGAEATIRALELGAVDIVAKPVSDIASSFSALRNEIVAKVKAAATAKVGRPSQARTDLPRAKVAGPIRSTESIVAIGASTGGVEAIGLVLKSLPADGPAIAITQHMPPMFTSKFADRLDGVCPMRVHQATDGERMLPGHAYIAPGDTHLQVGRSGANYICRVRDTGAVSGHCPSVDVLFRSVATHVGVNAVGVILTGMGRDGAEGMAALRAAGGRTIGQDEATSVVYGMPKAAFEAGGVERQVPLGRVGDAIMDACRVGGLHAIRI